MLETWLHWFASDAIGIIAVAPLVIGIAAVVRRPSPRSEVVEGALALVAFAVMTGLIILLAQRSDFLKWFRPNTTKHRPHLMES